MSCAVADDPLRAEQHDHGRHTGDVQPQVACVVEARLLVDEQYSSQLSCQRYRGGSPGPNMPSGSASTSGVRSSDWRWRNNVAYGYSRVAVRPSPAVISWATAFGT